MNKFKHVLSVAALGLAAFSNSAQAAVQTWNFAYAGFYFTAEVPWWDTPPASEFRPDLRISGSFSGEDLNHDGLLVHGELTSVRTLGYDFKACESDDRPYTSCGVGRDFNFRIADKHLTMNVGSYSYDEAVSWSISFSTATGYSQGTTYPNHSVSENWHVTDRTLVAIDAVPAPVPEPETYAMMGIGLAALGLLTRRRQAAKA